MGASLTLAVLLSSWPHPEVQAFGPSLVSRQSAALRIHRLLAPPLPHSSSSTALRFKVSETEDVDVDVDEEEVVFDGDGEGGSSSSLLRRLVKGLPLITTSLGFAVTPSSAIAMRVAGAAAGGVTGMMARRVLLDRMPTAEGDGGDDGDTGSGNGGGGAGSVRISPSVAQALNALRKGPPPASLALKALEQIARKHRVSADELGEFFTHAFADVVYEAIQSDSDDLTVLSEVVDFAEGVGLTAAEVGDGFAVAATRLGRQLERDERGFFTAYPRELLLQAAKVFFLADKMVGSSEGYYGRRLAVVLSFYTTEELRSVVTKASTGLFKRCVESVLLNPDAFTPEEVATMKGFLDSSSGASSLRPATMQNLIMEGLQLSLTNALDGAAPREARVANYEELRRAQDVLGWSSIEFEATVRPCVAAAVPGPPPGLSLALPPPPFRPRPCCAPALPVPSNPAHTPPPAPLPPRLRRAPCPCSKRRRAPL